MQPVIHNCSRCENEIIVACYPPKGRDPQEAGTIFPADCPVCGKEVDRWQVFAAALVDADYERAALYIERAMA